MGTKSNAKDAQGKKFEACWNEVCYALKHEHCPLLKLPQVSPRDVPGKEREKTGTGKKRERNAFFPFPFLHFWAPVFFPFLAKIVKNG